MPTKSARVRSSCEFYMEYGDKTAEEAGLNYRSLVERIRNNIKSTKLKGSNFKINKFIDFEEFMDMVGNEGEFKQYTLKVAHKNKYNYVVRIMLNPKSAKWVVSYKKVPDINVAREDIDFLEKKIIEVLKE
ncbi:MAG: hypothetical protein JSW73_00070 [Candidatus Woesearchaeota archaeon]|nr:MAG: hypothetical protein JSW73_00070 [Candidatus Woesearchaeota archaeon]